jgi:hypothetical protein
MALIFFTGFDTYATADITKEFTTVTGFSTSVPGIYETGGRRGGGALRAPNNESFGSSALITLPSSVTTFVCGFAFYANIFYTDKTFALFKDSGTKQLELQMNSDGTIDVTRNGTVLGTSSASMSTFTYHYIEFKATINNSTGSYELRLDGVNILSASGVDTQNTANASINSVTLGSPSENMGGVGYFDVDWRYDDFYVLDTTGSAPNNNFLGDVRIDSVYPTGDGNYTQYSLSTGSSHYQLVDEATPNTTDYVYNGTDGNKDSFAMGNVAALTAQTIYGVRVKAAALKDDAGTRTLKVGVRSGSTDSVSSAQALTTSQLYVSHILETDPNTSAAWTESGVNALESLIETAS